MRTIKFRVWNNEDKIMWHEFGIGTTDVNEWFTDTPKHLTVMQFTGLLDKNDKEIWEDDIVLYHSVKHHPKKCRVVYEAKAGAFLLLDTSKGVINVYMKYLGDIVHSSGKSETRTYELCEIIGNIYENPELLDNLKEGE